MKEHPIIFSSEMVRAILEDRKTQTRRVIKPPPDFRFNPELAPPGAFMDERGNRPLLWFIKGKWRKCPYGVPGDHLWVRETWQLLESWGTEFGGWPYEVDTYHGPIPKEHPGEPKTGATGISSAGMWVIYKADGEDEGPWRPSIYMPRWASRITLEVVNVRVERVQDISEQDAKAEGAPALFGSNNPPFGYIKGFERLWDSINAKRGYSWQSNPWVWVVTFKMLAL